MDSSKVFHQHEIESLEEVVIKAPISADDIILAVPILGAMASRGYNIPDLMRALVASRPDAAQILEACRQMFGDEVANYVQQSPPQYRITLKLTPIGEVQPIIVAWNGEPGE